MRELKPEETLQVAGGAGHPISGSGFVDAWIARDVYTAIGRSNPELQLSFGRALYRGSIATGSSGQAGIKRLHTPHYGYTHELKVVSAGAHLLERVNEARELVFDRLLKDGLHKNR